MKFLSLYSYSLLIIRTILLVDIFFIYVFYPFKFIKFKLFIIFKIIIITNYIIFGNKINYVSRHILFCINSYCTKMTGKMESVFKKLLSNIYVHNYRMSRRVFPPFQINLLYKKEQTWRDKNVFTADFKINYSLRAINILKKH